jgi:hypothetical protein
MSTFDQSVLLARARISALRALARAGGRPTAAQLLRAVDPVLGDLLPVPTTAAAGDVEREFWRVLVDRWQAIDAALTPTAASPVRPGRGSTVVTSRVMARR